MSKMLLWSLDSSGGRQKINEHVVKSSVITAIKKVKKGEKIKSMRRWWEGAATLDRVSSSLES